MDYICVINNYAILFQFNERVEQVTDELAYELKSLPKDRVSLIIYLQ